MPNNLGRDQLWTPQIWADIDQAVLGEIGSIRVVQKVFNSTTMPNAANVPADEFDQDNMKVAEGRTKPFIELSVEFSLTQSQVDNEATLHTAKTLAKLAAKSLALAEDTLLLQGDEAQLPKIVKVINKGSAEEGLIGDRDEPDIPVKPLEASGASAVYGPHLFTAVVHGIAELTKRGQPGPYALLLETSVYADAFSPVANTLVTTADRLSPLLTGGFYGSGAVPKDSGLLISLGGEPTTIYVAQDAITAYTQENRDGSYLFRVFERVQFVARDRTSAVNLKFLAAAKAIKAA
jgi:uncharacterized linocin/CFP29 family protein